MRSPLPDAVLLGSIAMSAIVSVSAVGALLVDRAVRRPPATARLICVACPRCRSRPIALVAVEGARRHLALGRAERAARSCDRRSLGLLFRSRRSGATPGRRRARSCPGSRCSRSSLPAAVRPVDRQRATWTSSRRRRRSATGRAQVGGDGVVVHQLLQPNSDPHDYEPRPDDVVATAGADVVLRQRLRARPLDEQSRRRRRAAAPGSSCSASTCSAQACRATPALVARPAERDRAVEQIRDALIAADPRARGRYRATHGLPRALHAPRRGDRRVHGGGAARRSGSSSPTTTRSATSPPLRHPRRRRGHPLADDAGAAVRGRHRRS